MANLAELSIARAGLPEFPGATVLEQLVNGRDTALAILKKYRPDFQFDWSAADKTMREVGVWEERNRDELAALLKDQSSTSLPDAIRIKLGNDRAQAFVLAGFTQAAYGLGPWTGGAVIREASSGVAINDRWARDDADARLAVFATIVKMESDGYLHKLFIAPTATGFLPVAIEGSTVVWAVVVTLVAVAALVLGYFYLTKTVEQNNRLMRDLCEKAQKEGDQATIAACIKETAGLQKPPGAESFFKGIGQALVVVGALYVGWQLFLVSRRKRSDA